jgi:hypothetical protein
VSYGWGQTDSGERENMWIVIWFILK